LERRGKFISKKTKVGQEDARVCSTNKQTFDLVWRFECQVIDKCLFLSEKGWGKNSRDSGEVAYSA
jgi:hypothetical protein